VRPRRRRPFALKDTDPTGTLRLRASFVVETGRRLALLKRWIRESVVDRDCFGLKEGGGLTGLIAAQPREFAFRNSEGKVDAFMSWLRQQEALGLLEVTPGTVQSGGRPQPWSNLYVRSAYQRGLAEGRRLVRAAGVDVPSFEEVPGGIAGTMNQPFHSDRLGLLFTRTFTDLRGVSEAMDAALSRELAQGMGEGIGPYELARRLTARVDSIGLVRARTVARTEVVRAHGQAALNEFEATAQLLGEEVKSQWWTALDERVCPVCGPRHGKVYEIKEVRGIHPAHPNCRCALLPVIAEEPLRKAS
jgi:SPP1 gp7 family putative phage head morphogenesis protein